MVQEVMRRFPNVDAYFGELDAPLTRYLPNHWVAEFLYWSVSGDSVRATAYFLILLGTLVALLALAAAVAGRFYYPGWAAAGDVSAARPPVPGGRRWFRWLEFGRPGPFAPALDVILRRDAWAFFREPSQWLHLLMMLLLLVVFVISMGSMEMKLTQPLMQTVSFLVVFLFNGFMIASICLRFVFPAVSLEGEAFWSVRSSPVSLRWLFRQKFLVAGTLITLAGEALAIVSTAMLRDNRFLTMVSALLTLFIGIALTGLNLGAGAYFATYREKNPIRIASSQGASLTFLGSMLYLGFVALVLVLPLRRYFDALILRGVERMDWIALPVTIIALVSLLLGAAALRIGRTAIQRDY
jgi:ABC-2 type transport system permease protein